MFKDYLVKDKNKDFHNIYEVFSDRVYTLVNKYVKQPADAEDIVQNIFIHIWNRWDNINGDTKMDAIFIKTARQEISKWYAKRKDVFLDDFVEYPYDADMVENPEDDDELMEKVKRLLDQAPEKRKQIFLLHKFEQRSINEIAKEMNMTPSAVTNQISLTLKFIRKQLSNHPEFFWILILLFQ
ncbi:RNA polymerase sigma factor [Cloacibacterium sp.]|uniref:RNA polymerase sigma factor n=1 Tax=Cloacibacterium sp. TaxID=1913682 RepID=UPI0039E41D33